MNPPPPSQSRGADDPRVFDDADYTRFRARLLRKKGSPAQRRFLEQVRHGGDFIETLGKIETVGTSEAELIPYPLTENEYKEPPVDTERALYESWSELAPAMASRSAFWGHLTLEHLRHSRIQPIFLAANGGSLPGGAERIDRALADRTARKEQLVDRCVRTILRRLGGLPEVRGNRSVYVDCPFARSWWRERMVEEAANGDPELARCARSALRINQTYWEKFIDRVVFRNSTFGSANIRSSFIRALGMAIETGPSPTLRETTTLQSLCRRASAYQGSRELGILDERALDRLFASIVDEWRLV